MTNGNIDVVVVVSLKLLSPLPPSTRHLLSLLLPAAPPLLPLVVSRRRGPGLPVVNVVFRSPLGLKV